ncbi:MAG: hypothetical protein KKH61_20720, partial [Gammaproteobacteria bacterium]|nr:hypothetical protein [Gammaproteobacteria bacterium]
RACVRWALDHGIEGKPKDREYQKMRHAIIHELKRLGLDRANTKAVMLDWNKRNLLPLSLNDARRQLCAYVDWLFKQTSARLSCKALKDFCISSETDCLFAKPDIIEPLGYSLVDAAHFIEKTDARHAHSLIAVLRLMLSLREEMKRPVIYVGSRRLCALLFDREGMIFESIEVLRLLRKLSDIGFITIASGQAGTFGGRRANEYRVLDWKPDVRKISSICATK